MSELCIRMNQTVSESPKSRRLVLMPFQRLRRRTTAADDDNKHGGASGHVTTDGLPVIDERSMTSRAGSCQNGGEQRAETLLDAMHKKYYPDQYGVTVATGSDVSGSAVTSVDVSQRGTTRDGTKTRLAGVNSSAVCRTTATTLINNNSLEGASSRPSLDHHRRGNCCEIRCHYRLRKQGPNSQNILGQF